MDNCNTLYCAAHMISWDTLYKYAERTHEYVVQCKCNVSTTMNVVQTYVANCFKKHLLVNAAVLQMYIYCILQTNTKHMYTLLLQLCTVLDWLCTLEKMGRFEHSRPFVAQRGWYISDVEYME